MSFYEDQEDDWFANDCKGVPSDYYAGELAPWQDNFTDTSAQPKVASAATKHADAPKQRRHRKRLSKGLTNYKA